MGELAGILLLDSGDMNMMSKKEISRIPYPAKQRLSLWPQLHPIPEMQHQLPHLIATRMVLHFLWIIRPTLDGSHYAGRQWGKYDVSGKTSTVITPPLNMSACFCGVTGDAGMACYSFGFDQNIMTLYSSNHSSTLCNLIMVGKI